MYRFFNNESDREIACKELCESGKVKRGREGHEFWRKLGEVRHIYAFLLTDGTSVRLISKPMPSGTFDNLTTLERTIKA